MELNKKFIIILIVVGFVVAVAVFYSFGYLSSFKVDEQGDLGIKNEPKVVEENLTIPETKNITGVEGRMVNEGAIDVLLVPKSEGEKVIVSKAILTVKGSYNLALVEAQKWSSDVKLVFIKSLGTVTLDGKSSQWQLVYSSKNKPKKGYEVIIQGDQIVSKKEVDSNTKGIDFPFNMLDSGDFVKKLQERPAFADATLSSFLLASTPESTDVKWWFSISTSKGTITFEVK